MVRQEAPVFPMSRISLVAACCALVVPWPAATARAEVVVRLDATALPAGALASWSNTGSLGGAFTPDADVPQVATVAGVNGVTFDGANDWYVGPVAPTSMTGNGNRTVTAWIYNPAIGTEETVAAWGRRGGGNGTLAAYTHGTHAIWGAVGQWGNVADMGWGGAQRTAAWTFVAFTYDGAALTTSVYTDGRLSAAELNGPLNTWATSTGGTPLPIVVGAQNNADGSRGSIPASLTIAKLEIHDRALTAAEVAAAFNTDAAAFGMAAVAAAPSIEAFAASREATFLGTPVTLSWSVHGATSFAIDPGVAIPAGQASVDVAPATTTTYTLTAASAAGSATRSVTVIVDPGSPVAADQTVTVPQGTATWVTLQGSDPNTPPTSWTWVIATPPAHGVLTGTAPALTYTPAGGYAGTDSFTFTVNDGLTDSNTATVRLQVDPPPAAPTAVTLGSTVLPGDGVAGTLAGILQATDPNFGETHSFQLVAGTGDTHNALFSISGNQLVLQQGVAGLVGTTLSVRVRGTDNTGRARDQVVALPVVAATANVVINEIHYNPDGNTRTEFIELHNPTAAAVDLAGWRFSDGITFTFAAGTTIAAGGYVVVASDPAVFQAEYGFTPLGPYEGGFASEGEKVELRDAGGTVADGVEYQPEFPWPVGAGGGNGPSMELVHPSLDNNLGGSWRSSASSASYSELTLIPAAAEGWRWRPGTSEASSPTSAWRQNGFAEDATWTTFRAPIGFGGISGSGGTLPLNTTISGMRYNYLSIFARKTFTIAPGEIPASLLLRYCNDDGILVWINGTLVAQRLMATTEPTIATDATTWQDPEGLWYEVDVTNAATFLVEGTNTLAVQLVNDKLDSSDLGLDLELVRPAASTVLRPTPGARNTVFSATVPPQIRQVAHHPRQPKSTEAVTVTAKVTDPQGVGQVQLLYQVVAPGDFIPARFPRTRDQILADPRGERPANPAFEDPANWTGVAMVDDGSGADAVAGDSVFTATVPAQAHRTLVRYRIAATDLGGASLRVPYADDPSLNFAWFVYDGVPDYVASAASVAPGGAGKVWPKQLLTSVPVYHWLIRAQDMAALNAYNSWEQFPNTGDDTVLAARRAEDWEGAFVYDGIVYDHVGTRLRGGNSRYGDYDGRFPNGKRHYKFQFNDGHRFQARDERGRPYPQKWKSLAFNKMFGTKGGNGWGMPEEIGATLWSAFGVPAASTHWFHFRVIDGAAEAPDQYNGDFWGLYQVVEEYEGTFLEARGLAKGNLYKMSDWIWDADRQRRYQCPDMVRDGSEFNNIRDNTHPGQSAVWLQQYVNCDKWFRYSAVAEAIRHYDIFPYIEEGARHAMKNIAWYFEPAGSDPARGLCWWLPYDWDASFGPNFNNGWDHVNNTIYGWDTSTSSMPAGFTYIDKPQLKLEHRNVLREFRDLVWQPDQVNGLIDDRARVIAGLSKADQDRWRNAPVAAGSALDDPLEGKVADMKRFCFEGWVRDDNTGPAVPGGRDSYLDSKADAPDTGLLPTTPTISYAGEPGFPVNGLVFQAGAFSDPQGAGTFAAMAWRVGEIEDPTAPAYDPDNDFILEAVPVWESGALPTYQGQVTVPGGTCQAGHSYRARVRMQDGSGRWSHWSAPVEFTATAASGVEDLAGNLVVSEIHYHPLEAATPAEQAAGTDKNDFEFIELRNISPSLTLDLAQVAFTTGITFSFAGSAVTSLAPGAHVVVVKNAAAFAARYGTALPVAGAYPNSLDNAGERIVLAAGGTVLRDFTYDDAAPWPAAADGSGPSLVLRDPLSNPDHGVAANWRASVLVGGSPGADDTPFAFWMARQGIVDPAGDPDGDGLGHALVYALGGDLLAGPSLALPVAGVWVDPEGGSPHLSLSYRCRPASAGVRCVVEVSPDLVDWRSGEGWTVETAPPAANPDGTLGVTVRMLEPLSAWPAGFLRLRVEVAP